MVALRVLLAEKIPERLHDLMEYRALLVLVAKKKIIGIDGLKMYISGEILVFENKLNDSKKLNVKGSSTRFSTDYAKKLDSLKKMQRLLRYL